MKKTSLGFVTAVFCIVLTAFRIPLKLFDIDLMTGFYFRGNMLGIAFNCLFFFLLCASFYVVYKNKEDFQTKLRVGSVRTVLLAVSSVAISLISALRIKDSLSMEFGYENSVSPFLVFPAHILGVISGIVLLFLSMSLFSGAMMKKPPQALALVLPVWSAVLSLCDFLSFRYTTYASDETIYSLFMLASTLFFLYFARSLIFEDDRTYLYTASLTCICGFPLAIGQLCALYLLEGEITGPSYLQCFGILAVSMIAFCFIMIPAKKLKDDQI